MNIQDIISAIQEKRIRITDHADEEAQADTLTFDEIIFKANRFTVFGRTMTKRNGLC